MTVTPDHLIRSGKYTLGMCLALAETNPAETVQVEEELKERMKAAHDACNSTVHFSELQAPEAPLASG